MKGPIMLMVLSIVATFSPTTGLNCFQCSYTNLTHPCVNPDGNLASVECTSPIENRKPMCLSVNNTASLEQGEYYRGCTYVLVGQNVSDYCRNYDYNGIRTTACFRYCSSDNCNGDWDR